MLSKICLVASLLLASTTAAPPSNRPKPYPAPACSWDTPHIKCTCPKNTWYTKSTTWATIGANARDVGALIGDFLETAWFGTVPVQTTGLGNVAGATRGFEEQGEIFWEKLVRYDTRKDGSFVHKYEQLDPPITYNLSTGPATYAGAWDTLETKNNGRYKTDVTWSLYACFGVESPFASFHESAINNATAILEKEGKIRGKNVAPHSEEYSDPH